MSDLPPASIQSPAPSAAFGAFNQNAVARDELSARREYEQQIGECRNALENLQTKHVRLVWIRTALFILSAISLLVGYMGESNNLLWLIVGWSAAAAFLVAIIRHEHLRLNRLYLESDLKLFDHLIARLDRAWQDIPEQPALKGLQQLDYADDLDLAGDCSLLSLLSLCGTYAGRQTLQDWMTEPVSWRTVRDRQKAVQALVPARTLRLQIIRTIRATSTNAHQRYGLPGWAESPNWLPAHPLARILSYIGPAIVLVSGCVLGVAYFGRYGWLVNAAAISLGIGFLINILVTVFWGSWIHDIFQKVTGEHRGVYQFAEVFRCLGDLPDANTSSTTSVTNSQATSSQATHSPRGGEQQERPEAESLPAVEADLLAGIKQTAIGSKTSAVRGFSKLMNIVRLANFQRDPVLYVVYLVLQLFLLWDFRVLKLLEAWKSEFGTSVADWFHALGRCEACISAATLADEYPRWCFPTSISEATSPASTSDDSQAGELLFDAEEFGHPLLQDEARVVNSFQIHADRPLVVVTGSNMAGKSTFLRSIGLNVVLSRTGAPVCAQRFRTPTLELASSIRIRDSLSDGVSFFMAELKRLKQVVDSAQLHDERAQVSSDAPRLMFLLDEILQGTNSQERQIAVATVLQQLLRFNAIGLISTHDLDLAHAPEVQDISQVVHFREYFEEEEGREVMKFDYRMRPGPTPTTNALKLLQFVGLQSTHEDSL